ncbi:hypothetical protein KSS87_001784 [Heliosperma pusillum]|nr:hypothetical protein KSS87_001784 [Heliosperma pusillum]
MGQIHQLIIPTTLNPSSLPRFTPFSTLKPHFLPSISLPYNLHKLSLSKPTSNSVFLCHPLNLSYQFNHGTHLRCKFSRDYDSMSQLELGKEDERRKPEKRVNGVFWIILLNIGLYVADHILQIRGIKMLYLYHNRPAWYQFVTAAFCHASWNHLSSNLFFLYIFGKLVEEEEGNFGLWLSYLLTGAGANLVSWLVLPRNTVSVGASGAVFGLFAISVLVKLTFKASSSLSVEQVLVMEAAQASTGLINGSNASYALQTINHVAHLSGALFGVLLVWLLSKVPSQSSEKEVSPEKPDKTR